MRGLALFVAIAGLGAFTLAGLVLRDRFVALEPGDPAVTEEVADMPEPKPVPPPEQPARPVAPEAMGFPVEGEALERIDARKPLGEIGAARSPSEGPPAETILFRPVATAGGAFTALGYEVRLAGIVPTDKAQECAGEGGVSWPCGIHARTAFRNWLRGRALTCIVPPAPPAEPVVSKCLLAGQDAAAWLVEQGWAKAEAGGDYAELEEQARAARRGLFGPAPAAADGPSGG